MNLNQRGLAGYQRGQIRWCAPVEAETSSAQLLVDFVCRTVFSVRTLSTRRFTIRVPFHSNFLVIFFFLLKSQKEKYFIRLFITCLFVIEGTFEIRGFVFTFESRSKERTNCISLKPRVLR